MKIGIPTRNPRLDWTWCLEETVTARGRSICVDDVGHIAEIRETIGSEGG